MKRIIVTLVAVAVLGIAASEAFAGGVVVGWGPPAHVVRHHHGWYGPAVVYPPVIARPAVVVPCPAPATVVYPAYPPIYRVPQYYYGGLRGTFQYSGPGVSVGVGF